MRSTFGITLAAGLALAGGVHASTQDFAFLVQQRVTAFQCPGYAVDTLKIEDAIFRQGKRLGWSRAQTIREMEGRRIHQVAKHQSNPSGYCRMADELSAASHNRLRSLGVRP